MIKTDEASLLVKKIGMASLFVKTLLIIRGISTKLLDLGQKSRWPLWWSSGGDRPNLIVSMDFGPKSNSFEGQV